MVRLPGLAGFRVVISACWSAVCSVGFRQLRPCAGESSLCPHGVWHQHPSFEAELIERWLIQAAQHGCGSSRWFCLIHRRQRAYLSDHQLAAVTEVESSCVVRPRPWEGRPSWWKVSSEWWPGFLAGSFVWLPKEWIRWCGRDFGTALLRMSDGNRVWLWRMARVQVVPLQIPLANGSVQSGKRRGRKLNPSPGSKDKEKTLATYI